MVGPFPVAGWLAIAGAGAGAGLLIRRSNLFEPAPEPVVVEPDPSQGLVSAGWHSGVGPVALPTSAGPVDLPDAAPTTNEEWTDLVVRLLITRGVTPSVADAAIRNYLAGNTLTAPEVAAVNMALSSRMGPPPEGAPPIVVREVAAPVNDAPTPPNIVGGSTLGRRTTTVKRKTTGQGESPREIALRVYGAPEYWNYLAFFNSWIKYRPENGTKNLPPGRTIAY
jgi:hypothetical protein